MASEGGFGDERGYSGRAVLRVGSRKSPLALVQTHGVMARIKQRHPHVAMELVTMTTKGDDVLDVALSKLGETGVFTRELEQALVAGSVDLLVHSLKDVATQLPAGLALGAVCARDDPRDAVVMRTGHPACCLDELAEGAAVGTSSLRRAAQLARRYPALTIRDVRGNLNTRLRKLDEGRDYDCLVLAAAGLDRMQWSGRVSQRLEPAVCMYAVAQGAVAVECRHDDSHVLDLLACLQDHATVLRCVAERAMLRQLEGGCSVPVAVHTELKDGQLSLKGGVFSIGGAQAVTATLTTTLPPLSGPPGRGEDGLPAAYASIVADHMSADVLASAEQLGTRLASQLLVAGAGQLLTAAKAQMAAEVRQQQADREARKAVAGNPSGIGQ